MKGLRKVIALILVVLMFASMIIPKPVMADTVVTKYEAESGTCYGGTTVKNMDGRTVIDWFDPGRGVEFQNVVKGNKITLHYANYPADSASSTIGVYVNGTRHTVHIPGNYDWHSYVDASANIEIPEGATVKIQYDVGDFWLVLDYITIEGPSTETPPPSSNPSTHSGSWSIKGSLTGDAQGTGITQDVSVTAGTEYTFKAWVKGSGKIAVVVHNGGWDGTVAWKDFDVTSDWTEISVPVSVGSQTQVHVQIQDANDSGTANTVFIDDVFFGIENDSNLLNNSDLESGNTGWNVGEPFAIEIATPAQGFPNTHSGSWSAKGTFTQQATWLCLNQDISVTQNTNYIYKAWIKGTGKVALLVKRGDWASPELNWKVFTVTDQWTEISVPISSGDNTSLHIQVQDASQQDGIVYIDDVFFGIQDGANLLTNAGFESGDTGWDKWGPFKIVKSTSQQELNSVVTPSEINFDKSGTDDVTVGVEFNGNTLSQIKNDTYTLVKDTDYTIMESSITIKNSYLKNLSIGAVALTFEFSAGDPTNVTFNVFSTAHNAETTIGRSQNSVDIDGVVETDENGPTGDWENAGLSNIAGTVDGSGNSKSAKVYFKYDYDYLYIGAKIKDPTPMINSNTGGNIWNGDNLEVFLGCEDIYYTENPGKIGQMLPSDAQLVLSGGIDYGYQFYTNINGTTAYPQVIMEVMEDADHKGYTIEAAVPLNALNISNPWDNKKMILNTVLNDGGSSGRGQWGWTTNSEGDKKKRGQWGLASFEPASAPQDQILVSSLINNKTQDVNITGSAINVTGKIVTMITTDQEGNIVYIDETTSDQSGEFSFNYKLNKDSSGNGTYLVTVGGEDIYRTNSSSFDFTYTEPDPDTTAPTAPSNLRVTTKSATQISMAWDASEDENEGVTYDIYRDDTFIQSVTDVSFTDSGLEDNTSYSYYVIAKDAAGNLSAASNTLTVKTDKELDPDTTAPAPTSTTRNDTTVIPGAKPVILVKPVAKGAFAESQMDSNTISKAFEIAKADAKGIKTIQINIEAASGVKEYIQELPKDIFLVGSEKGTTQKQIEIKTSLGTIIVPDNMLKGSEISSANTIGISIGVVDTTELNADLKAKIGNKPVVEIKTLIDNRVTSWNNNNVPVTLTLDYKPTADELKNTDSIVILYIDGSGKTYPIPSGKYDGATGTVTFTTTHFSKFAVAFNFKTFEDIKTTKWAEKQIEFVASKGIMEGAAENQFNPGAYISRAEFIDVLMKALGLSSEFESNFSDIKKTDSYYESIGAAKKLGITMGTGNGKFNPDSQITRQEMSLLVLRAMKLADKTVETGNASDLKKFTDASQIANYAADAFATLVKNGVLAGEGNRINSAGKVTRAQTAVVMYKLYNAE